MAAVMAKPKPKKAVKKQISLQVKAAQANPAPPIGTALGPQGVNIAAFVAEFNDRSSKLPGIKPGTPLPVKMNIYEDRSFDFEIKSPPASYLLMDAIGAKKGSSIPNKDKIGKVNRAILEKIAMTKLQDMSAASLETAIKTIAGTARSMGIEVEL